MFEKIRRIKNLIGTTIGKAPADGEFLLRETDFGTVHLDASAIRRVVERTRIAGVHEIKNVVVDRPTANAPLNIRLNLIIDYDLSAPKIGANLRDEIKAELNELFGIIDATFDIRVTKITDDIPEKRKRRVR